MSQNNRDIPHGALGEYLAKELTAIIKERSETTQGKLERRVSAEIRIVRKLAKEFSQEAGKRNIEKPVADESEAIVAKETKEEKSTFNIDGYYRFGRLNSLWGW